MTPLLFVTFGLSSNESTRKMSIISTVTERPKAASSLAMEHVKHPCNAYKNKSILLVSVVRPRKITNLQKYLE